MQSPRARHKGSQALLYLWSQVFRMPILFNQHMGCNFSILPMRKTFPNFATIVYHLIGIGLFVRVLPLTPIDNMSSI